jgi:predicted dehydrogenase
VATQVKQWRVSDTGGTVDVTAPDTVFVHGLLENGAVAAAQIASVPHHGSGARLEIYGTDGALFLTPSTSFNIGPIQIAGARNGKAIAEITVPAEYTIVPEGTPSGRPFNVGQAYARYADAVRSGDRVDTDFDLAERRHRMLDAIERSSDKGELRRP